MSGQRGLACVSALGGFFLLGYIGAAAGRVLSSIV
jgi:hypothetical protein